MEKSIFFSSSFSPLTQMDNNRTRARILFRYESQYFLCEDFVRDLGETRIILIILRGGRVFVKAT